MNWYELIWNPFFFFGTACIHRPIRQNRHVGCGRKFSAHRPYNRKSWMCCQFVDENQPVLRLRKFSSQRLLVRTEQREERKYDWKFLNTVPPEKLCLGSRSFPLEDYQWGRSNERNQNMVKTFWVLFRLKNSPRGKSTVDREALKTIFHVENCMKA